MTHPTDAFATRAIALVVLALLDVTLAKLLPLGRRELKAALIAGLVVGAVDVITEATVGAFGVWRYALSLSVLGIPVDLFFTVSMVSIAMCLGYAAALRRGRAWRAGYVVAATVVVGSWALFHNTKAIAQGIIRFASPIDVGTPWFVLGNYALVGALVVGVATAYSVALRLQPPAHA